MRRGCRSTRAPVQIARVQRRPSSRRTLRQEGNQRQTGESCKRHYAQAPPTMERVQRIATGAMDANIAATIIAIQMATNAKNDMRTSASAVAHRSHLIKRHHPSQRQKRDPTPESLREATGEPGPGDDPRSHQTL